MSGKSIWLSILSIVLTVGVFLAMIFLWKVNFLIGFASVILLIIPAKLRFKALDEASGVVDKVLAKYVVPIMAGVILILTIMSLALWIK